MKALELPPTIRTAREDEVTPHEEVLKRLKARQEATIVEGYRLQQNPSNEASFRFFSEINIDNSRLWALFSALAGLMPTEVSLIYGQVDEEPSYGRYMNKQEVLDKLSPYKLELTQDGLLEFGVIYQDEERLQEVFVKKAKYIQYWGVEIEAFRQVMKKYELNETPELSFMDDFPLATEPLKIHRPEARETGKVVQELQELFS